MHERIPEDNDVCTLEELLKNESMVQMRKRRIS